MMGALTGLLTLGGGWAAPPIAHTHTHIQKSNTKPRPFRREILVCRTHVLCCVWCVVVCVRCECLEVSG